jgi:hypothetical protein
MDLHLKLFGLSPKKRFEPLGYRPLKNRTTIFRAPYDVVFEREDGPCVLRVSGIHPTKDTGDAYLMKERQEKRRDSPVA